MRYSGSCHCGAVAYEFESEPIGSAVSCNCSWCGRRGSLLHFTPADDFTLLRGEAALSDYRFNTGRIEHLFCATCGVESFSRGLAPDGATMAAINLRCVEGVDPDALAIHKYDGKAA